MADRGFRGGPTRTERADRLINEGHSRGLDVALANIEAKIRNMKTERVYAFDKNGMEITHTINGQKDRATLSAKNGQLKDSVITHNHPNVHGNTIAGRVGTTLSYQDVSMAIRRNIKEMRVVTKEYTYSLKRKTSNWGVNSNDFVSSYNKEMRSWADKYKVRERADKLRRGTPGYQQFADKVNNGLGHSILKTLASRYGWNYTRKKTS